MGLWVMCVELVSVIEGTLPSCERDWKTEKKPLARFNVVVEGHRKLQKDLLLSHLQPSYANNLAENIKEAVKWLP